MGASHGEATKEREERGAVIFFLTTARHQYTLSRHLTSYGAALKPFVRLLSYEQLFRSRRLSRGVYVFSDLERLWPDDAERAARFWHVMSHSDGVRTLNHPTRSLRRYELLRTMHLRGTNRFNVYRLTELRPPDRFPVYLRGENDHDANRTPLLHTVDELAAACDQMDQTGHSRENTLITEYLDVSDPDGVFHKYSAFCVAGTIIPRHLCFERKWMVKQPVLVDAHWLAQEREYLATNPHETELRGIFQTARIDYGRIDYAVVDGVIQVWEINTNPMICTSTVAGGSVRESLQGEFAAKFQRVLEDLDAHHGAARGRIRVDPRDPTRVRTPKTLAQRIRQALRLKR